MLKCLVQNNKMSTRAFLGVDFSVKILFCHNFYKAKIFGLSIFLKHL